MPPLPSELALLVDTIIVKDLFALAIFVVVAAAVLGYFSDKVFAYNLSIKSFCAFPITIFALS